MAERAKLLGGYPRREVHELAVSHARGEALLDDAKRKSYFRVVESSMVQQVADAR